jgi:hypothetical protein
VERHPGTPTAFGQHQKPNCVHRRMLSCLRSASAEGVGALLARDLARSGSKSSACGGSNGSQASGFAVASRQIVGKVERTPALPRPAASIKS